MWVKLKNCRKDIIYHYISFVAQRGMAEFNWSGENKWWMYIVVMDCDVQLENELKIDIDTHIERERERERDDQESMRWCWLYCNTLVMYPYWVNWFSQHANINEGKKYIYWYSIHTIISY